MIAQHLNQSKNRTMININVSLKSMYVQNRFCWNPSSCIRKTIKYLKCVVDNSVIFCYEIIKALGSVSTKGFIESTNHQPADHRPLTHIPTDPPTTNPPTNRTKTHRPN